MDLTEFSQNIAVFRDQDVSLYRYPSKTEVHKGWKAAVYNTMFVDLFHALPKSVTRNTGYHMVALVQKSDTGA